MEACYLQTCEQAVTGMEFIHKCQPTDRKGTDGQMGETDKPDNRRDI